MKEKLMREEELNDIAATIDNEGFWCAVKDGLVKPSEVIEETEPGECQRINDAIVLLTIFERNCPVL